MAAAPSFSDLFNAGRAELVLRRPDLFAEEGDVVDFMLALGAAGGDYAVGYAAARFREVFLDTSSGDSLTTLADDRWAIVRQAAVKAIGSVTLSRPTFTAGAGSVSAGTIVATQFDALGQTVEFETTALVSFGATDLSKTAAVQAKVAGAAGNVAIGAVNRVVSLLFDTTIVVANAARMAGGSEEESDEALRERVRTFPATLRRGTLAALEYGAKSVAGVETATASEGETGLVTVYVADSSGNSNAELDAAVQLELVNWRAAGVVVQVLSAELREEDFTFTVKAKPGFDVAASAAIIQAAVTARVAKLAMGEVCYLDELKAAVIAIDPDRIQRVTFSLPTADITPASQEVIRAGAVTVTAE